ncbi:hypothetical protein EJ03DRAFT_346857 [Teratosphaeria nubilosa]|uniref:Uncharacterized protein n=1 Tax=Teratosphaeria nubilosa TaxID=161662 RepID=A0A6G1LNL9_9PEZI|nr:hypothetical protein EJ03DRAFT_346857 [Teratosphaeria nubilosa]
MTLIPSTFNTVSTALNIAISVPILKQCHLGLLAWYATTTTTIAKHALTADPVLGTTTESIDATTTGLVFRIVGTHFTSAESAENTSWATTPNGRDFNLVAEAAKRAQMACLARDLGDVGL